MTIPNFVMVRIVCQLLSVRASAFLAAGQPDEALKDLRVIYRFSDALASHHTLVAAMIRVAIQGLALGPVWEGWAAGTWKREHYAEIRKLLEPVDLLTSVHTSMNGGERAGVHYIVENYPGKQIAGLFIGLGDGRKWRDFLGRYTKHSLLSAMPRGWWWRNLIVYDTLMRELIAGVDPVKQRIFPGVTKVVPIEETAQKHPIFGMLCGMAIPNFNKAITVAGRNQNLVNFAILVCALETQQMETGSYPDKLEALAPARLAKLPHDLVSGAPLHYEKTAGGGFRLYAVGANGTDDGGILTTDAAQGDWVWPEKF